LTFKGLTFKDFIDVGKAKLQIDINKLITAVKKNSKNISFDEKSMMRTIELLKRKNHDPWQVCCGHDMVQILAVGFRKVFGKEKSKTLTAEVIEGMLRLTYKYDYFCNTALCRSKRNWENANPIYTILKVDKG
jgi:hypothetical protein